MITMDGKYQTRIGMPVRVFCVDLKSDPKQPILAAIRDSSGREAVYTFAESGRYRIDGCDHNCDIIPIPQPPEYIPFDDSDRDEVRGKWIKSKCGSNEVQLTRFGRDMAQNMSWQFLFDQWTFLTGEPFGKIKK